MNWVDKRAEEERILKTAAPRIWEYLCAALFDAIQSCNENYCKPDRRMRFEKSGSSANPAGWLFDGGGEKILDVNLYGVRIIAKPGVELAIGICEDGSVGLLSSRGPVDPDAASKLILEPILF